MVYQLPLPYFDVSVCVYINHGCNCGPYLNQQKVLQLPSQYGPGVISRVMYDVLKGCVECAYTEKVVYNLVPEGNGKVIVSGESSFKHSLGPEVIKHFSCTTQLSMKF